MMRSATCLACLCLGLLGQNASAQESDAEQAVLCTFYEVVEDDPHPAVLTPTGPKRLWLSVLSRTDRDEISVFDPTDLFGAASVKNHNFSSERNRFAIVLEDGDRIIAFGTNSVEPEIPHRADVGTGRYNDAGELFEERYVLTGNCMFFETDDADELRREIGTIAEQDR